MPISETNSTRAINNKISNQKNGFQKNPTKEKVAKTKSKTMV